MGQAAWVSLWRASSSRGASIQLVLLNLDESPVADKSPVPIQRNRQLAVAYEDYDGVAALVVPSRSSKK